MINFFITATSLQRNHGCTTAIVRVIPQPQYTLYDGRRMVCMTAVVRVVRRPPYVHAYSLFNEAFARNEKIKHT